PPSVSAATRSPSRDRGTPLPSGTFSSATSSLGAGFGSYSGGGLRWLLVVPVHPRGGDLDEHFLRARDWNRQGPEAQHLRPACRGNEDGLLLLRDACVGHRTLLANSEWRVATRHSPFASLYFATSGQGLSTRGRNA